MTVQNMMSSSAVLELPSMMIGQSSSSPKQKYTKLKHHHTHHDNNNNNSNSITNHTTKDDENNSSTYMKKSINNGSAYFNVDTHIDDNDLHDDDHHTAAHHSNGRGPTSPSSAGATNNNNKLNSIMLATIVFYSVSGGPFGIEESVRAAGNFYTLLGLLIMPFVWSIPEAIMTTELGPTFVDAAGGVAWVEHAFGYGPGFMVGYLGWIAGVTDNAIYPVLFMDYVLQGLLSKSSTTTIDDSTDTDTMTLNPIVRFILLTSMTIILSYINWLGLPIVGRMSVIICCVAMSPFVLLTVIGMFKVDPNQWFIRPDVIDISTIHDNPNIDNVDGGFFPNFVAFNVLWRPFLNNLFWNLNSFDSAASFSEDVDNPGVAYPKAMKYAVLMVFCGYLFPLLVAFGASDAKQSDWVDGYLATITSNVVGKWLGEWTVFAAGISNIALYQAELSTEAYQLMGMAERGYVPSIFATRSPQGTPTYCIILGTCVVIVLVTLSNLSQLIEMLNFSYAIALLMEYAAFIKLRITHNDLPRPWRLPFNTTGCILLFIPPFICTTILICLATYKTYIFSLCVNSIGVVLYISKQRGYWGSGSKTMNNASSSTSSTTIISPQKSPHEIAKGTYNLVQMDSGIHDDNELELEMS